MSNGELQGCEPWAIEIAPDELRPQKLFIGLMDFFSILLLGALLTWLLMADVGSAVLGDQYANLAGVEAWAAFLFASYHFGRVTFLPGSWLDEFYGGARRYRLNRQSQTTGSESCRISWNHAAASTAMLTFGLGRFGDE